MIDVDRYRREVGRIYLGDRFINMEMVRDGFAWRYVQYDKPGSSPAHENDAPRIVEDFGLIRSLRRHGNGEKPNGNGPKRVESEPDNVIDRRPIQRHWQTFPCPECGFENECQMGQAERHETVLCRGCHLTVRSMMGTLLFSCRNKRRTPQWTT